MNRTSVWQATLVGVIAACALIAQPPGGPRGFGGGPGGRFGMESELLHGTVTGAPFSATEKTQMQRTLENGTQVNNQRQSSVYRDAQGRVRIDTTFTPPAANGGTATPETMSTIYDPVAGYTYRLNPQKMTAVQMPIRQRPSGTSGAPGMRTPPAGVQTQTQDLGTSTINGVSATGTKVIRTIAAGTIGNSAEVQIVRTTWVSTALQVPVQVTMTDPLRGDYSINLTNIVQGAPNASLFQVPSGYTVTTAPRGRGFGPGGPAGRPQSR